MYITLVFSIMCTVCLTQYCSIKYICAGRLNSRGMEIRGESGKGTSMGTHKICVNYKIAFVPSLIRFIKPCKPSQYCNLIVQDFTQISTRAG